MGRSGTSVSVAAEKETGDGTVSVVTSATVTVPLGRIAIVAHIGPLYLLGGTSVRPSWTHASLTSKTRNPDKFVGFYRSDRPRHSVAVSRIYAMRPKDS